MYVPEGICVWLHSQEVTGSGPGYFIHDDGHMIPRNDVLIVLSLPPNSKKKERCRESGAEHFLLNDFVEKNDKLWRYKQKTLISGTFTSSSSFSNWDLNLYQSALTSIHV